MNGLRIFLAASVITVLSHPLPAQQTQNETASAVHKGDQWTYNDIDDITGNTRATLRFTVTEVSDKEIAVRSVRDRDGRSELGLVLYDLNWNETAVGDWKKLPRDATGIELPLAVGKEWHFKHRNQNTKTGVMVNVTTSAKVVRQETRNVGSQQYDTFKIETQIHQVQAQAGKSHDILISTWYAPAINRWVKRSFTLRSNGHIVDQHTQELVEFLPAK